MIKIPSSIVDLSKIQTHNNSQSRFQESVSTADTGKRLDAPASNLRNQLDALGRPAANKLSPVFAPTKAAETERIPATITGGSNHFDVKMNTRLAEVMERNDHNQNTHTILQMTDHALSNTSHSLSRMKELATQAESSSPEVAAKIQKEMDQLAKDITQMNDQAQVNGHKLTDGSLHLVTQTQRYNEQDRSIQIEDMRAKALGVEGLSVSSPEAAKEAIKKIEAAQEAVNQQRTAIGKEQESIEKSSINPTNNGSIEGLGSTIQSSSEASERMDALKKQMNDVLAQDRLVMELYKRNFSTQSSHFASLLFS